MITILTAVISHVSVQEDHEFSWSALLRRVSRMGRIDLCSRMMDLGADVNAADRVGAGDRQLIATYRTHKLTTSYNHKWPQTFHLMRLFLLRKK